MLWELAAIDPLAPVVGGPLDPLESLLDRRRRRVLLPVLLRGRVARARPDHGDVGALTLAQRFRRVGARSFESHSEVRDEPQRHLRLATAGDRLSVAGSGVLPFGGGASVIEHGVAVEAQLDVTDDAARGAQQDVLRLVVARRPAVGAGSPLAVVPGTDAQRIADDQPARPRAPRGLQHQRSRQVAAAGRHLYAGGPESEAARGAVEVGREHTWAVRPRQAHPLDPAAGRDEAVDLAVGEEGVVGDGREGARDSRLGGPRLGVGVVQAHRTVAVGFHRLYPPAHGRLAPVFRPRPTQLPRGYAHGPPDALENGVRIARPIDDFHRHSQLAVVV